VRDDKGNAQQGTVTLIPDPLQPQRTSLYQLAETDENGRFQLQGLRPGKYRLYAWEEFEAGSQFDPDVTAPFQARSVAIEVAEGGRKEVAVTRISVEEVEAARKPR
jgi:protocatechuate 3,4-dioxygenase beta subunit